MRNVFRQLTARLAYLLALLALSPAAGAVVVDSAQGLCARIYLPDDSAVSGIEVSLLVNGSTVAAAHWGERAPENPTSRYVGEVPPSDGTWHKLVLDLATGLSTSIVEGDDISSIAWVMHRNAGREDWSETCLTGPSEVPPVITLLGEDPLLLEQGVAFVDPGFVCTDNIDGDCTATVDVSVPDFDTLGDYVVTYSATDSDDNTAEVTRRVRLAETGTPPVLTVLGDDPLVIKVGSEYADPDPAFSCFDELYDGDCTDAVTVDLSGLDTNVLGAQQVVYRVVDSAGLSAQAIREVQVRFERRLEAELASNPGELLLTVDNPAASGGQQMQWPPDQPGGLLVWDVEVDVTSTYELQFAIACEDDATPCSDRTRDVVVGGVVIGQLSFSGTGGWSVFEEFEIAATLEAGIHTVELRTPEGGTVTGPHVDYLDVVFDQASEWSNVHPPVITVPDPGPLFIPLGGAFHAEFTCIDDVDGDCNDRVQVDGINVEVEGSYRVTYNATDAAGNVAEEVEVLVEVIDVNLGWLTRSFWEGVSGGAVSDLTGDPAYPDSPTSVTLVDSFESVPSADLYGVRMQGFLYPPASGWYTFRIASDNSSQLWLSTDDNEANAALIAEAPGFTSRYQWDKFPQQTSAPVYLRMGRIYYIEALHKESTSNQHLAVAWQGPNFAQQLVPNSVFSPLIDRGPAPVITVLGESPLLIEVGGVYTDPDPAFSCFSERDGDCTGSVTVDLSGLDTDVLGEQQVVYRVVDSAGLSAQATREVEVRFERRLEAEQASNPGDLLLTVENPAASGGQQMQWPPDQPEGLLAWDVEVDITSTYELQFAIACEDEATLCSDRTRDVVVGGAVIGQLSFESTGGWAVFEEFEIAATLEAGTHTVELRTPAGGTVAGPHVDYLDVVFDQAAEWSNVHPPVITVPDPGPLFIPLGGTFHAEFTCIDDVDGDCSEQVQVDGISVDVEGSYRVTFNATDAAGNAAEEVAVLVDVVDVNLGWLKRSFWEGIGGRTVSDLTGNAAYPDSPSSVTLIDTARLVPRLDNYGERLQGFLYPPRSGWYTFLIASDDGGQFWLSTDNNPSGASMIAEVPGGNFTRLNQWDKFPEQTSAPVYLRMGRVYYFEARHKEGTGDDHLSLAWRGPDFSQQLLPSSVFSPPIESGLPVITVLGENPLRLEVGSEYAEPAPAFSCFSERDGDCTGSVTVDLSGIDTHVLGSQQVVYRVVDSAGFSAQATREVEVRFERRLEAELASNPGELLLRVDNPAASGGQQMQWPTDQPEGLLAWDVEVDVTSTYELQFAIACQDEATLCSDRTRDVVVGGAVIGQIGFESTGGWSVFEEFEIAANLEAGAHTVELRTPEGSTVSGPHVDYLDVVFDQASEWSNVHPPVITIPDPGPLFIPLGGAFHAEFSCVDDVDGDCSDQVQVDGISVDVEGSYRVTFNATDAAGNAAEEVAIDVDVADVNLGWLTRSFWEGISGRAVSELTGNAAYPDSPSSVTLVDTIRLVPGLNNYGERLQGFLYPPASGWYTFLIASDDAGQFWLSTDNDPSGASMIAEVPGTNFTRLNQWDKFPEQTSAPVYLRMGRVYYFEVLHKEGTGDDHVSVAWIGPDFAQQIVPNSVFSP